MASPRLEVEIGADVDQMIAGFREAEKRVDKFDKNVGKSALSAGQGVQSMNSAVFSLNQVVRDSPFFARDPAFGFIAISNNIPPLIDQFQLLSQEAAILSKQTGKNVSAFKLFVQGLAGPAGISLAISAAISLFTAWALTADTSKKSTDDLTESLLDLSGAIRKGSADASKQLTSLDTLYKATQDAARSIDDRRKAVDELQKMYPKYLGNIDDEAILAGEASDAYKALRTNIIAAAQARALQDQIIEREKAYLKLQPEKLTALEKSTKAQQELNEYLEIYNATAVPDQGMTNHLNMLRAAATGATSEFKALVAQSDDLRNESQDFARQLENFSVDQIIGDFGVDPEKLNNQRNKISEVNSELFLTSELIRQQQWGKLAEAFDETARAELGVTKSTVRLNAALKEVPTTIFSSSTPGFLDVLAMDLDAIGHKMLLIDNYSELLERDLQNDLSRSFQQMFETGEFTFESLADAFSKTLQRMAAELAASAVIKLLGTILSGGTGGLFGGGLLGGLFGKGSVFKFASGGIVTGPTLGLMGEYPGASNNPEVIAPLSDLKNYMPKGGGNVHVSISGKLQGNDMTLMIERVIRDYNRMN